jgi:riboflavin kinase/FMN adenylyltransferase
MRVFYQLDQLPQFKRAVLTIGSFDGVHCGHQELLARINRLAKERDGESIVITFHPHPRLIVYPKDKSLQLLSTIEEKVALFEQYGVDNVVVVPFTVAFSQLSADEYIENFLLEKFNPSVIVIGYDHKFGLNRQGDIDYLKWHSKQSGFELEEIAPQEVDKIAVSSTKIRRALQVGEVAAAKRWLGHAYQLTGKVVHGQHLGTELGFPTANIKLADIHKLIPADGIYAVEVIYENRVLGGMLYIGNRPTIAGVNERVIEVNIFDFQEKIYGQELTVRFIGHIRNDQEFNGLAALKTQLAKDRIAAQKILQTQEQKKTTQAGDDRLAIVILNFNGEKYLREYLPGVIASVAGTTYKIIVADNASTDGSLKALEEDFPVVERIVLNENLGFANGYNEALKLVDADYYVLLNSDVRVTDNWIAPCLSVLQSDKTIAACQPKIKAIGRPDHFEYAGAAGGWIDSIGYPFCRGRIFSTTEQDKGQYDDSEEVFWASGAALFIKAELYHAFGGFDGAYFAHAEEIDLCWRLKRAGYRIMSVPQAEVFHLGGGTLDYQSVRKTYLNFRNTLITSFKNEARIKLLWWLPLRLLMDGLAGLLFLTQGKWTHISAIIRAHWHFFPRINYWYRRRKEEANVIRQHAIGPSRLAGVYRGSIVWAYYARGIKYFQALSKSRLYEKTKA